MFFGNSTSAEEIAIQDARIVGRALETVLTRSPLVAAMRESGVTGQPAPSETRPLDEPIAPPRYWRVGDPVGLYPVGKVTP